MMFEKIIDEQCIENTTPTIESGLGFIDDNIIFQSDKVLKRELYSMFKNFYEGFEIHQGISKKYPLCFEKANIKGTFVHGIFDDEKFKIYKEKTLNEFIKTMKGKLDIDKIISSIM